MLTCINVSTYPQKALTCHCMGPSSGVRDVCIEHTLGFFLIATKKVSQPRNRLTPTNQEVVYKGLRATQRLVPPTIAVIRLEFSLPVNSNGRSQTDFSHQKTHCSWPVLLVLSSSQCALPPSEHGFSSAAPNHFLFLTISILNEVNR